MFTDDQNQGGGENRQATEKAKYMNDFFHGKGPRL